jgi:hypothetical protein
LEGWEQYFRKSEELKITPLSLLYFPEGGALRVFKANHRTMKSMLLKKGNQKREPFKKYENENFLQEKRNIVLFKVWQPATRTEYGQIFYG